MIAAARWATERGAGRVIAAAPVGSREAVDLVRREADEVVCPCTVDDLGAVGLWYVDFPTRSTMKRWLSFSERHASPSRLWSHDEDGAGE